ncbi:hypothetical protein CFB82_01735 [Burkholderia sp. HI2714]|nr:hypothetical protein CFB82_01735 [Burkholderia sp. HI2714]
MLTLVGLRDGEMQWVAHCRMFAEIASTSLRGRPGRGRISSPSNGWLQYVDAGWAAGLTFWCIIASADEVRGRIVEQPRIGDCILA